MSEEAKKQNEKRPPWLTFAIVGIAVGIVLLIIGGGGSNDTRSAEKEDNDGISLDAKTYEEELENRIKELCYGIRGVGKVTVMVSLKGGYKTVYAMDAQSSSGGYRSEIVKVGSGSNQEGIITGYENPEISGVGIVCTGGDDAKVKSEIVSLVSATLDISTNKIFVATGEK